MSATHSEIPVHVASFETELGSKYSYLPDGRTQRFRQVDEELKSPQDAIVFVHPYERVISLAPEQARPFLGTNEAEYLRRMIIYTQKVGNPNYRVRIINEKGNILWKNADINAEPGQVYLAFMSDKRKIDYTVPVGKEPKEGSYPFDTTRTKIDDETHKTTVHLGNRITKINFEN